MDLKTASEQIPEIQRTCTTELSWKYTQEFSAVGNIIEHLSKLLYFLFYISYFIFLTLYFLFYIF